MEYIVNGSQAREIDRCSIQEIGIPSMVLMEKGSDVCGELYYGTGR